MLLKEKWRAVNFKGMVFTSICALLIGPQGTKSYVPIVIRLSDGAVSALIRGRRCSIGEKIGRPLVVVTGTPRILPKTLPRPEVAPVEEPVKEREKVPVGGTLYRTSYATMSQVISRMAKFLGITEQQVVDPIVALIDKVTCGLKWLTPPQNGGKTVSVDCQR